jgi:hypothetical protein
MYKPTAFAKQQKQQNRPLKDSTCFAKAAEGSDGRQYKKSQSKINPCKRL